MLSSEEIMRRPAGQLIRKSSFAVREKVAGGRLASNTEVFYQVEKKTTSELCSIEVSA
jgi:hypothetical protein